MGVNVQKFHRLVAAAGISPVVEGPGKRGAKFWRPKEIEKLAARLRAERIAELRALTGEMAS